MWGNKTGKKYCLYEEVKPETKFAVIDRYNGKFIKARAGKRKVPGIKKLSYMIQKNIDKLNK